MSPASAFWALTVYTAKRLLAPGRLLINLAIFGFPIVVAAGFSLSPQTKVNLLAGSVLVYSSLYIVLIASSLFNALAVTSQELEDGSALYVYGGILPRSLVLLNRFFVVWFFLTAGSAASFGLMFALLKPQGLSLDWSAVATLTGIAAAGLAAYVAFYMACAAWFRHSMAACLIFTVMWEVVVFATPTQLWPYTVTTCMRNLVRLEVYDGRPPKGLLFVFEAHMKRIELLKPGESLVFLGAVCLVALVIAAWAMSRRQIADPATPE